MDNTTDKTSRATVDAVRRSGIGRTLELTDADRTELKVGQDAQAARLARIAARAAARQG